MNLAELEREVLEGARRSMSPSAADRMRAQSRLLQGLGAGASGSTGAVPPRSWVGVLSGWKQGLMGLAVGASVGLGLGYRLAAYDSGAGEGTGVASTGGEAAVGSSGEAAGGGVGSSGEAAVGSSGAAAIAGGEAGMERPRGAGSPQGSSAFHPAHATAGALGLGASGLGASGLGGAAPTAQGAFSASGIRAGDRPKGRSSSASAGSGARGGVRAGVRAAAEGSEAGESAESGARATARPDAFPRPTASAESRRTAEASALGLRRGASPPPAAASSFAAELAMLRHARRALREGDGQLALRIVASLDERFPNGLLLEERGATRILGLCRMEHLPEARQQAHVFLRRYPASVYAERVRSSCVQRP